MASAAGLLLVVAEVEFESSNRYINCAQRCLQAINQSLLWHTFFRLLAMVNSVGQPVDVRSLELCSAGNGFSLGTLTRSTISVWRRGGR